MSRLRTLVAAVASLAILAAGCGAAEEVREEVGEAAEELRTELTTPGGDDGGAGQPGGGGGPGGQPGGGEGGGSGGDGAGPGPAGPALNDLGPVGANGWAMLRASVARLVVEIDAQQGAAPDDRAVAHLRQVLAGVVDKPAGITVDTGGTFASDRTSWTTEALRAVAGEHRDHRSGGDTVAVYALYVRGSLAGREGALGVAHNASEVALFPERWQGTIGGLLGSDREVEQAVLVHEVGHLLGLVNLTYTSAIEGREDPEHPGHSASRDSVMFWAIESTAIQQVFSGPPPDTFDDWDRQDLQGLKAGRY